MKKVISLILLYILGINQAAAGIFLYQIMPNTTDDKNLEYIEIYNSGTGKIDLEGYKLKDKSGKTFDFGYGEYIQANSIKKYFRTKTSLILNNTNEELYLLDNNNSIIDNFSYSSSTKSQEIQIYTNSLSNTGTTNTGSTSTGTTNSGSTNNSNSGSTNSTNSGTTNSGTTLPGNTNTGTINSGIVIENINLIYEFQNPSYVIDKTINLEKYICDESRDECKINLNLENSFSGTIKQSDYKCEIDFGLKGWKTGQEDKCNPTTITFPKGVFNIKMKIISKSNPNIYSEKSFILENNISPEIIEKEKIVYKDKTYSSSSSSSHSSSNSKSNSSTTTSSSTILKKEGTGTLFLSTPIIKIQSGIKNGKCTKTDCNVNLIYEANNSNIECQWDFGIGTFKTANTDKKCNPGYVKYPLGNHQIKLKIFDKYNPSNYKINYLNFSNEIIPKKQKEDIIIDKLEKEVDNEKIAENKEELIEKDSIVDIVDKKEIKPELVSINKNSKKNIKKEKLFLPYFMDDYNIPKIKNSIIVQGRLGNKILSGSTIKCFDKCSINFIAKDNKDIKEYLWNFGNGETFKGQNPSYVKYSKTGKYNVTLTTTFNNGFQNIETFHVNYQIKPKVVKTKKKKTTKKKYTKSKSKTKKKNGIFLTKEKLYSDYIPKKELNQNYIDKNNIGNYCSDIKYFPETINKFKILVLFLISLIIVLGGFIVMKKRELI